MNKHILQVNLKSVNYNIFKIYSFYLTTIFKKLNLSYSFVNLPKRKKRITLLKSPHVYKKAREQFEIITHRACFVINVDNKFSLIRWLLSNKSTIVQIKVKLLSRGTLSN